MHIHLFASHKEQFGPTVELPDCATVAELASALAQHYPDARPLWAVCRIAVNQAFADEGSRIVPGDELAVIPPVSGG